MSQRRVLSVLIILVGVVASLVAADRATAAPTIELEKAVYFLTPDGDNVVVGPGSFEVEADKSSLRLKPQGGGAGEVILVEADAQAHGESLDAPKVKSEVGGEDQHRILLLLPEGRGLLAVGTYSGIRTRTVNGGTATGYKALENDTGSHNSAFGYKALQENTSGMSNTGMGYSALRDNTTGRFNTATGDDALKNNTTGTHNTAHGAGALLFNNGNSNTAIGVGALGGFLSGNDNIGIGRSAGSKQTTGSNNIYINNDGATVESGTIKIGKEGTQTRAFIAGIRGVAINGGSAVVVSSSGQLGVAALSGPSLRRPSSRRFKETIQDMGEASHALLKLRPVTFHYRKEYVEGERQLEYGLIAEEVAAIYPDLVTHSQDGQVETVQYHKLITMLLNELQKEHQVNRTQAEQIRAQKERHVVQAQELAEVRTQLTVVLTQKQQLQEFQARLAKLEAQSNVVQVSLP